MAYLSAIAYENILQIDAWNCKLCQNYKISQPKAFINLTSGVVGYTGYSASLSAIVVVFRGANNINTFIQDLKTTKETYDKCPDCQVSKSFLELYSTVKANVLNNIESLHRLYRSSRIFVTGHGLGGVFAILAGADIKELYTDAEAVYTFGACRVGNDAFAKYYSVAVPETYRVIHYADVVPHLPIASAGYVHASNEIWYQSNMESYKICKAESPDCANSLPNSALNVADNSIQNYLNLSPQVNNILRERDE
jgi:predicted lipase